jgi:uncharacterized protein YcbK (DUF882 family)
LTGSFANSRAGKHTRWLALLVAATSLSGCMASALDTSAIQLPQPDQTFAYVDEDAFSEPRPPENLITGSTSDEATRAVPVTLPDQPDVPVTALVESEPASGGQVPVVQERAAPVEAVAATDGLSPNAIDPATARIYSAAGQQSSPSPRPPVSGLAKRTGSLLAMFSNRSAGARKALIPPAPVATDGARAELWASSASDNTSARRPVIAASAPSSSALPGVNRERALGLNSPAPDDDQEGGPIRLASAAGLARLAPNGLNVQTESVDVACLKPALVRVLKKVERHYGRNVVITSGYRNPSRNKKASGSTNSLHMYCSAADIQIDGVSKTQLAGYLRSMPGRGGVGTYCHTESVHIDIGPERDWNWRCRRKK